MNETLKLAITLMVISVFSAAALAVVYEKTYPIIQANKVGKLNNALKEVLPAEHYEEFKLDVVNAERSFKAFDKDDNQTGLIVLSPAPGFQSVIKVLIGIDTKTKTVTTIKILEHLETPGLGSRIEEPDFLGQFKQQGLEKQDFDAITGATISSKAVIDSVKETANEIIKLIEEGKI